MNWVIGYIDDDAVYANALRREFEGRGAVLKHYEEPTALLRRLSEDSAAYDMVLVDMNMADTAGVVWRHAGMQVARAVRNEIGGGSSMVCMLSGMDGAFLNEASQVNGADAYIEKELGIGAVADRILALLSERMGGSTAIDGDRRAAEPSARASGAQTTAA